MSIRGIKEWLPSSEPSGPAYFGVDRNVDPPPQRLSFSGPPRSHRPSRMRVWRTKLALWIAPWVEFYNDDYDN